MAVSPTTQLETLVAAASPAGRAKLRASLRLVHNELVYASEPPSVGDISGFLAAEHGVPPRAAKKMASLAFRVAQTRLRILQFRAKRHVIMLCDSGKPPDAILLDVLEYVTNVEGGGDVLLRTVPGFRAAMLGKLDRLPRSDLVRFRRRIGEIANLAYTSGRGRVSPFA